MKMYPTFEWVKNIEILFIAIFVLNVILQLV